MKPDCQFCEELILDYRWLSPEERRLLDEHLRDCPRCREDLRQTEEVGALFREFEGAPAVPDGFADRVMAAVRQPQTTKPSLPVIPALLAVLAVQAVAIGLFAGALPPIWTQATVMARDLFREWLVAPLAEAPVQLQALLQGLSGVNVLPGGLDWSLVGAGCAIVLVLALLTLHSATHDQHAIPERLRPQKRS